MSSDADVAIAAAQAGIAVVLSAFGTDLAHHAKEGVDFATDADVAAEQAIRAVLARSRPGDAVVGEELGATGAPGARRWLVDPLCGTLNFAAGLPIFAVNVALEVDGELTAAAAADPSGDVLWTDGATASVRSAPGDRPLHPSAASRLVAVNLESTYPGRSGLRLLDDAEFRRSFSPRVPSSTLGMAWVADGKHAAYMTGGRQHGSVHFAAGIALCRAAGAVVTALDGGPLGPDAEGLLVAADTGTHAALLARLRELAADDR